MFGSTAINTEKIKIKVNKTAQSFGRNIYSIQKMTLIQIKNAHSHINLIYETNVK